VLRRQLGELANQCLLTSAISGSDKVAPYGSNPGGVPPMLEGFVNSRKLDDFLVLLCERPVIGHPSDIRFVRGCQPARRLA